MGDGPARRVAQETGATVHGVDITLGFVEAARFLTSRCDLGALVTFEHVDVAAMDHSSPFDAAISVHPQMNVEDKAEHFTAIHAGLRPVRRYRCFSRTDSHVS